MRKKRWAILLGVLIVFLAGLAAGAALIQRNRSSLQIDGKTVLLANPLISEGSRILAAGEEICLILKIDFQWSREENRVVLTNEDTTVELTLNDRVASVRKRDGQEVILISDAAPRLQEEIVYIPLRFVAEIFGAVVRWGGAANSIEIITQKDSERVESTVPTKKLNRLEIQEVPELAAWFEQNHRQHGAFDLVIGSDTYILISAGVKPTGGFRLEVENIDGKSPESVHITARLTKPRSGDIVTMALTYPNLVLKFSDQTFQEIHVDFNE